MLSTNLAKYSRKQQTVSHTQTLTVNYVQNSTEITNRKITANTQEICGNSTWFSILVIRSKVTNGYGKILKCDQLAFRNVATRIITIVFLKNPLSVPDSTTGIVQSIDSLF